MLVPLVVVLFGKVVEPVGSGAFLEEGSQWGQACEHYNLALSPSPALSPS